MTSDYFAILGVPRLPWMDAALLKERFLALSSECHPDKVEDRTQSSIDFATLNKAYQTLRNSRERILHLLELEHVASAPHVQSVPDVVLPFFPPVASLTKQLDEFLDRKKSAASPMLQVQLFEEGLDWTGKLQAFQPQLADAINALELELKELNAAYADVETRASTLPRLARIAAALGFLERWQKQLQDRFNLLAL